MVGFSNKTFNVLWYVAYIGLLGLIAYLPHSWWQQASHHPDSWALQTFSIIALPVMVAAVEVSLSWFQKHISLFFARKLLTLCVALAILLVSTVLLYVRWRFVRDPQNPGFDAMFAIQFVLQGFVVGIATRELLLNMSLNNLFGSLIELQRLLFLSAIVIFLFLLPPPASRHGVYSSVYVLGFGIGLFAHFLLRRLSQRGEKVYRQKKLFAETAAQSESLSHIEREAVKHYVNRHWRKLRKLYLSQLELNKTPSTMLAIIESCMYRMRGQYDSALLPLEKIPTNTPGSEYVNGLLLLQKALVLSDLPGKHKEMYDALVQSLTYNPKCFLSNVTLGLHQAEDLPLVQADESLERQRPINLIREAMRLNADERNSELLSNLIGYSIPLSWAYIQDAYGYALLKAGDYAFSKSLFLDCIKKEPNLTSAYLHLGEWYLSDCLNHDRSRYRLTLANLCFSIATSLEAKKKSRIARRSEAMADQVKSALSKVV